MRLSSITITGLKRIQSGTCKLADATFLIGPNNSGKSTVLSAIGHLLSGNKRINEDEYYSENDPETGERKTISTRIILEGEFRDLPIEAKMWRGFKGRIFEYDPGDSGETGLQITYRKTYDIGKDVVIEIRSYERIPKEGFDAISIARDLISFGIKEDLIKEVYDDLDKKLTGPQKTKLQEFEELYDLGGQEVWVQNPGGIPGNVLCRLPRYIIIPAEIAANDISGNGVLSKTLTELFEDVRNCSDNYKNAQKYLDELAKELDPSDNDSEFGKMMTELNSIISSVFPESKIHAHADLSDPDTSLKPKFKIELSSNIKTTVDHQGAGMVRSAVFGVLRFRQKWLSRREDKDVTRSIIIGFEEPEIFLHPSAANQMRDTIYELSSGESQIIATTHSPFLIDLSRKPRQVLNRFSNSESGVAIEAFNVTEKFNRLQQNDKEYVKMILKIDDYISRVFFTKRIIIVEGDTEDIVIRESMRRLDKTKRLSVLAQTEIIKARGKATIIGLAKYLKSFGISPFVIHDRDKGKANAEQFNQPIADIVGQDNVIMLEECIEDTLGYTAPSGEKPYKAYAIAQGWGESWADIPPNWRSILEQAFLIPS